MPYYYFIIHFLSPFSISQACLPLLKYILDIHRSPSIKSGQKLSQAQYSLQSLATITDPFETQGRFKRPRPGPSCRLNTISCNQTCRLYPNPNILYHMLYTLYTTPWEPQHGGTPAARVGPAQWPGRQPPSRNGLPAPLGTALSVPDTPSMIILVLCMPSTTPQTWTSVWVTKLVAPQHGSRSKFRGKTRRLGSKLYRFEQDLILVRRAH